VFDKQYVTVYILYDKTHKHFIVRGRTKLKSSEKEVEEDEDNSSSDENSTKDTEDSWMKSDSFSFHYHEDDIDVMMYFLYFMIEPEYRFIEATMFFMNLPKYLQETTFESLDRMSTIQNEIQGGRLKFATKKSLVQGLKVPDGVKIDEMKMKKELEDMYESIAEKEKIQMKRILTILQKMNP